MIFDNTLGQSCRNEVLRNPLADAAAPYGTAQAAILNDAAFDEARATISGWEGYAPTSLWPLNATAKDAGVAAIHYKDESTRFGLGSFKALGGAYAVDRLLKREGRPAAEITVCCATDGNHGRSVAWGARTFGAACVIFIHAGVSEARKAAIEAYGATVIRTPGNYDDSVRIAQEQAAGNGWFVVSDTSYPGYTEVPKDVMQGYEVMAAEALDALTEPPTHIFLQTGVGGMAAAVAAFAKRRFGADRPQIVLADPANSACWVESLRAGEPRAIHGDLDTLMAGLACGEVSLLAWEILRETADAVVSVEDADATALMRALARPENGGIVAGESAVAGLAAALATVAHDPARAALGLTKDSRILVFGTEGDTDAALYQEIVGQSGAQVIAAR